MPSALETAIARHRAELVAADDVATKALVDAYAPARKRLDRRIAALLTAQAEAIAEGGNLSPTDVLRLDRSRELLAQVDAEMARLASVVAQEATAQQEAVIGLADRHALVEATLSAATQADAVAIATTWNRVNTGAVERLVGRMSNGSPLSALLTDLGGTSAGTMRDVLRDGVARGLNADALGRELARVADVGLAKAQQISRDAILGSYRDATLDRFRANSDIVTEWQWLASHGPRVCLACLSLSGDRFPLTTTFQASHSRCRCRSIAVGPNIQPNVETGQQWLDRQPAKTRREMFPPGARDAYDAGDLTLADFKQREEDTTWGPSYRQASITQAKANAKARRGVVAKPATVVAPSKPVADAFVLPPPPQGLQVTAMQMRGDVDVRAVAEDGLSLVGSVHADGVLPSIKVDADFDQFSRRAGRFMYASNDPTDVHLRLNSLKQFGPSSKETFIHEVGHFLDHSGIGEPGVFASADLPAMGGWRDAVRNSGAVKDLEDTLRRPTKRVTRPDGRDVDLPVDAKYVAYLLNSSEVWARSYSQYIAVRTGDPALMRVLREAQASDVYPTTWTDEEFEPIGKAIDELFRALGWTT